MNNAEYPRRYKKTQKYGDVGLYTTTLKFYNKGAELMMFNIKTLMCEFKQLAANEKVKTSGFVHRLGDENKFYCNIISKRAGTFKLCLVTAHQDRFVVTTHGDNIHLLTLWRQ